MPPDPHDPDRQLIQRCLAAEVLGSTPGVASPWEELALEWTPRLSAVVASVLGRYGGAQAVSGAVQDILQETFVSLLKDQAAALRRFQWQCPLGDYLASVAVHRTVAWLRRNRRIQELTEKAGAEGLRKELLAEEGADPSVLTEAAERRERLLQAIRTLPARERLAIQLHYWDGLPAQALGQILRLKPDSVRPYLMRVRKRLAELLKGTAGLFLL